MEKFEQCAALAFKRFWVHVPHMHRWQLIHYTTDKKVQILKNRSRTLHGKKKSCRHWDSNSQTFLLPPSSDLFHSRIASSNIWSWVKKTLSLFQDETNEMRLKGESCLNAHLIVTLVELDRPGPVGMIWPDLNRKLRMPDVPKPDTSVVSRRGKHVLLVGVEVHTPEASVNLSSVLMSQPRPELN